MYFQDRQIASQPSTAPLILLRRRDSECEEKIGARRKARRLCEKHPTSENIALLRKTSAEALYCKKKSWQNYVNPLTAEIWKKIRKIKGIYKPTNVPLVIDNIPIMNPEGRANALAEHFRDVHKESMCQKPHDFDTVVNLARKPTHESDYNTDITLGELNCSLAALRNNSLQDSITS